MNDFRIGLLLVCEDCGFDVELPDELGGTVVCTACGVAAWVDLPYAEVRRSAPDEARRLSPSKPRPGG